MDRLLLLTPRIELVAATPELLGSELNNFEEFLRRLNARRPISWPPPLNDEQSLKYFLSLSQKESPTNRGWGLWYCIRRQDRELLGNAGFKGSPRDGVAEIGY